MTLSQLKNLVVLISCLSFVYAGDCSGNAGGVANGECVKLYGGPDCKGGTLTSYKPTCAGNCYVYDSYNSLHICGDGTYGTSCIMYSDTNCKNEKTDTGNIVTGSGKCYNVPGAKSMKCFYRC